MHCLLSYVSCNVSQVDKLIALADYLRDHVERNCGITVKTHRRFGRVPPMSNQSTSTKELTYLKRKRTGICKNTMFQAQEWLSILQCSPVFIINSGDFFMPYLSRKARKENVVTRVASSRQCSGSCCKNSNSDWKQTSTISMATHPITKTRSLMKLNPQSHVTERW